MKKILFLCMIFAACANKSKNDDQPVVGDIILGNWTRVISQNDNDGDNIFVDDGSDCDYDNPWNFTSDKTLKVMDGILSCDPDNPINISTVWKLIENDTKLVIGTSFESYYFIELLQPNKMILRELDEDVTTQLPSKLVFTR